MTDDEVIQRFSQAVYDIANAGREDITEPVRDFMDACRRPAPINEADWQKVLEQVRTGQIEYAPMRSAGQLVQEEAAVEATKLPVAAEDPMDMLPIDIVRDVIHRGKSVLLTRNAAGGLQVESLPATTLQGLLASRRAGLTVEQVVACIMAQKAHAQTWIGGAPPYATMQISRGALVEAIRALQPQPAPDPDNLARMSVCAIRRRSDGYWWECGADGAGWNDKRIRQAWTPREAHREIGAMVARGIERADELEVVELGPQPAPDPNAKLRELRHWLYDQYCPAPQDIVDKIDRLLGEGGGA